MGKASRWKDAEVDARKKHTFRVDPNLEESVKDNDQKNREQPAQALNEYDWFGNTVDQALTQFKQGDQRTQKVDQDHEAK